MLGLTIYIAIPRSSPSSGIVDLAPTNDDLVTSQDGEATVISAPTFDYMMSAITILSLVLAAISTYVAIKLYTWRQTVDLQGALVPEVWGGHLEQITHAVNNHTEKLGALINTDEKLSKFVQSAGQETLREVQSVKAMLLDFQNSLDVKDMEISRLKEGYDFKIVKNILTQLISLHDQCLILIVSDPNSKSLLNLEILLRDILENSGLEIRDPPLRTDFAQVSDYVEVVGYTSVSDGDLKKGQISEVISSCYEYNSGEKN
jgi:hypothetical protein